MTVALVPVKTGKKDEGVNGLQLQLTRSNEAVGATAVLEISDSLQRRLGNRQIQLIAIGMYMKIVFPCESIMAMSERFIFCLFLVVPSELACLLASVPACTSAVLQACSCPIYYIM